MSKKLFIFYFLFMFISIGLFSIENGATSSERNTNRKKETGVKKKPYRHYSRYSNLC